jgi:hypothetical protein
MLLPIAAPLKHPRLDVVRVVRRQIVQETTTGFGTFSPVDLGGDMENFWPWNFMGLERATPKPRIIPP